MVLKWKCKIATIADSKHFTFTEYFQKINFKKKMQRKIVFCSPPCWPNLLCNPEPSLAQSSFNFELFCQLPFAFSFNFPWKILFYLASPWKAIFLCVCLFVPVFEKPWIFSVSLTFCTRFILFKKESCASFIVCMNVFWPTFGVQRTRSRHRQTRKFSMEDTENCILIKKIVSN